MEKSHTAPCWWHSAPNRQTCQPFFLALQRVQVNRNKKQCQPFNRCPTPGFCVNFPGLQPRLTKRSHSPGSPVVRRPENRSGRSNHPLEGNAGSFRLPIEGVLWQEPYHVSASGAFRERGSDPLSKPPIRAGNPFRPHDPCAPPRGEFLSGPTACGATISSGPTRTGFHSPGPAAPETTAAAGYPPAAAGGRNPEGSRLLQHDHLTRLAGFLRFQAVEVHAAGAVLRVPGEGVGARAVGALGQHLNQLALDVVDRQADVA